MDKTVCKHLFGRSLLKTLMAARVRELFCRCHSKMHQETMMRKFINLFGIPCNMDVIAAHRAWRTLQIMKLYRSLYGNVSSLPLLSSLRDIIGRKNNLFLLIGTAFFDWNQHKVSHENLDTIEEDLKLFLNHKMSTHSFKDEAGDTWEKILDKEQFKLWRCPVKGSSLYKYKVYGTYSDVTPSAFLKIQIDLEYRKRWDNHVVRLERVDGDCESGTELIYWATHFPLGFLYDRDYLFVRNYKVNEEDNIITMTSNSVEHPKFPTSAKFVRVSDYSAQMLIRPHGTFDDKGLDYVMSYYDNPQLSVPAWAINKMTVQSLPAFLDQLHSAALNLMNSNTNQSNILTCATNSSYQHSNQETMQQS